MLSTSVSTRDVPPQVPMALAQRLTHDSRFRAELEANPVAALAGCGIRVAPEQIPTQVRLPSSEALQTALRADEDSEFVRNKFLGFFGS